MLALLLWGLLGTRYTQFSLFTPLSKRTPVIKWWGLVTHAHQKRVRHTSRARLPRSPSQRSSPWKSSSIPTSTRWADECTHALALQASANKELAVSRPLGGLRLFCQIPLSTSPMPTAGRTVKLATMPYPNRKLRTVRLDEGPEAGRCWPHTSAAGSVVGAQILSAKCLVRFDPFTFGRAPPYVELTFWACCQTWQPIKRKEPRSSSSSLHFSSLEDIYIHIHIFTTT